MRSAAVLTDNKMELLQAYADGVNAYIANNPLPIEYGRLELTTVRPWDPIDSLVIGKAIAANLSLDIDIEPTLFERFFDGTRVAPRHVGVSSDGEVLFEIPAEEIVSYPFEQLEPLSLDGERDIQQAGHITLN